MINGNDLLALGYLPGRELGKALARAAELTRTGLTRDAILRELAADVPPAPAPKIPRRSAPAPLEEAIIPSGDEERRNVEASRRQMHQLLTVPIAIRGALMPDTCPAGSDDACIPVGGAIETEGAILPASHSADICCSMWATFFRHEAAVGELLDGLSSVTHFGPGGRPPQTQVAHPVTEEEVLQRNPFLRGLRDTYAVKHLATQGDGNHFAYLGRIADPEFMVAALERAGHTRLAFELRRGSSGGVRVLVTHHGSRGLGAAVYKRGIEAAVRHTDSVAQGIPKNGAWLDARTEIGRDYWQALAYVGRWTQANHQIIHHAFINATRAEWVAECGNQHNFVWERAGHFFHGKGATPAWADEEGRPLPGFIPLNMASPILMVLGRSNERFLSFAPHGAGRNFSRSALLRQFEGPDGKPDGPRIAQALADSTRGVDVRWFGGKADLSESPIAYKNAGSVRAQIESFGLADIIAEILPEGCIMAGQFPKPWEIDRETPKQIRTRAHRAERRASAQAIRQVKIDPASWNEDGEANR